VSLVLAGTPAPVNVDFPFHFDDRGRTAAPSGTDEHIRDLLEQLLFTNPGERVNRPDFGVGLLQLIFAPNSVELAATLQYTTHGAIQRWLGDVLDLHDLEVRAIDSELRVEVVFTVRRTGEQQAATFVRGAG
jgi:phage baseplate assembly protein W